MKRILLTALGVILLVAAPVFAGTYFTDTMEAECRQKIGILSNGTDMCRALDDLEDNLESTASGAGGNDIGFDDSSTCYDATDISSALDELCEVTTGGNGGAQIIGVDVGTVTGPYNDCVNVEECLIEITSTTSTEGAAIVGYDGGAAGGVAGANVAAALDDIENHLVSTKFLAIPLSGAVNPDDAIPWITAYTTTSTAGYTFYNTSELAFRLRTNTGTTEDEGVTLGPFIVPADIDTSAAWTVHALTQSGDAAGEDIDIIVLCHGPADEGNTDLVTTAAQEDAVVSALTEHTFTMTDLDTAAIATPTVCTVTVEIDGTNTEPAIRGVWIEYTGVVQ